MTAMMTVKELLETDTLALPHTDDRITEKEVLEKITAAARCMVGSFMWLTVGNDFIWPVNDQLPDEVNISFFFDPEDILQQDEEV